MVCKYCQAELEEGVRVCPSCGQTLEDAPQLSALDAKEETLCEVTEQEEQEVSAEEQEEPEVSAEEKEKEQKKEKLLVRVTAIISCAVLVFALVAGVCVAVFGPGRKNDLAGNAVYQVEDPVAIRKSNAVVATAGKAELSNGLLQVIYWDKIIDFVNDYYSYLAFLGFDYTQPMYEQMSGEDDLTWEQYFLRSALHTWHRYQALVLEAEANGYEIPADMKAMLEGIPQSLTIAAAENNFTSADALAEADYGVGATCKVYEEYMWLYYTAISYFDVLFKEIEITEQEVEAYYAENSATLQSQYGVNKESGRLIDVRHILLIPEGGVEDETGNVTYSETEWEKCRADAQKILDDFLAGEATENAFSQLALQYTQDPGSKNNGGLYEKVVEGKMVPAFNDWCFDESRKPGDTGLVKTEYGYHIMYFVYGNEGWFRYSEEGVRSAKASVMLDDILKKYPLQVSYQKIAIGAKEF